VSVQLSGRSLFVEANGLRHHLRAYGAEGTPAAMLLPGITSPAATADFVAARLARQGFAVYVPDIRGRGETDVPPAGSYTLRHYADDVAGLVTTLELARPVVIGHSMGARIAAAYATEYAPGAHGPVVLVDPPLSGPDRGPYPTSLESFMAQLSEARAGTTIEAVRRFYPKWPERELRLRLEALPSCDETAIRETHAGFESEDFFPYWRALTAPALLIYGLESPVVTARGAEDLHAANPVVPMIGVPGAGHMIPWDNYDGFFEALLPWLAAVVPAGVSKQSKGE